MKKMCILVDDSQVSTYLLDAVEKLKNALVDSETDFFQPSYRFMQSVPAFSLYDGAIVFCSGSLVLGMDVGEALQAKVPLLILHGYLLHPTMVKRIQKRSAIGIKVEMASFSLSNFNSLVVRCRKFIAGISKFSEPELFELEELEL